MRLQAAVLALGVLAGCAGVKTYPTDSAGNLVLRADLDPSVRAAVHVHAVDRNCETQYQGRVLLQAPSTVVAIPPDRLSYLVVVFDTSSFWRGASSASVGTLFRPRAGQVYELVLNYRANLYDVAIRETKGARREVTRRDLSTCRVT